MDLDRTELVVDCGIDDRNECCATKDDLGLDRTDSTDCGSDDRNKCCTQTEDDLVRKRNGPADCESDDSRMRYSGQPGNQESSKSKQNFKCTDCGKFYQHYKSLRKHVRQFHKDKPYLAPLKNTLKSYQFQCDECPRQFNYMKHFRFHKRTMHKEAATDCGFDDRNQCCTQTEDDLGRKRKDPADWESDDGRMRYSEQPGNLESSDRKQNFKCTDCGKFYQHYESLRKHLRQFHKDKPYLTPLKNELKSYQFQCDECSKQFNYMKHLRFHKRTVHKEAATDCEFDDRNKCCTQTESDLCRKRNAPADSVSNDLRMRYSGQPGNQESSGRKQNFKCTDCGKFYQHYKSLRKHVRQFHKDKPYLAPLKNELKSYQFPCDKCSKQFNYMKHLRFHKRTLHEEAVTPLSKLNCVLCQEKLMRNNVVNHYENIHDLKIESFTLNFESFEKFCEWKLEEERITKSKFIKKCAGLKRGAESTTYFNCHRSGHYLPSGKGLRHLKAQGSNKINGHCPAKIKAHISGCSKVYVEYIKTHVGHKNDIMHLTKAERDIYTCDENSLKLSI